jgi:phage-related minor tail protein
MAAFNAATPFAKGGIVTSPMLGLVGEAGPEAIIPLSRSGNSGIGATINLTVNAGMGTQGAEVGRQIVEAIRSYERSSGRVFAGAA